MLITAGITDFLRQQRAYPLLDWYLKYGANLETQIYTIKGNKEGKVYTDALGNKWWNLRIPSHADTNPEYTDKECPWNLDKYTEAIGTTGWNWVERKSYGWGFDFDAIAGHATGLTDDDLNAVRQATIDLPYVSVYKSSGGKGYHLWINLEQGFPTANHTEHAAIGRALLHKMSLDAKFSFTSHVDVCGQNMWIWHRKATPENGGYQLIKAATDFNIQIPTNYRDHINVVNRKQLRATPINMPADEISEFDKLSMVQRQVPLDDEHHRHIQELNNLGVSTDWDEDRHMLHTHTVGLKQIFDKLQLKGKFETNSAGHNLQEPNCFMVPKDSGAWRVIRFGKGVKEAATWEHDEDSGYTKCWFNIRLDKRLAFKAAGGKETTQDVIEISASSAQAVLDDYQSDVKLGQFGARKVTVSLGAKNGQVEIIVPKMTGDTAPEGDWKLEKGNWITITKLKEPNSNDSAFEYENIVRHYLAQTTFSTEGWAVYMRDLKRWSTATPAEVKTVLQDEGYTKPEAECIMGKARKHSWCLTSEPFQEEYPGNRLWNRHAIQLADIPLSRDEADLTAHPHWDMVLNHIGCNLDRYTKASPWAQEVGITTGAEYLTAWIANLIRYPFGQLPYLFLAGPYNSGKSILPEAISLLFTCGVVMANNALTNNNDFNGELAAALVAYIEEKDLSKSESAAAKLRQYVTGKTILIRKMRTDSFEMKNKTHFIQIANDIGFCPILPKDTRIMVIWVDDLKKYGITPIPKDELLNHLTNERRAFLRTLLDCPLPEAQSRLRLELIDTPYKAQAQQQQISPLEEFLRDFTYECTGSYIYWADFYRSFWDKTEDHHSWTESKTQKKIPAPCPVGTYKGKKCVGNIRWKDDTLNKPILKGELILNKDGQLEIEVVKNGSK